MKMPEIDLLQTTCIHLHSTYYVEGIKFYSLGQAGWSQAGEAFWMSRWLPLNASDCGGTGKAGKLEKARKALCGKHNIFRA